MKRTLTFEAEKLSYRSSKYCSKGLKPNQTCLLIPY